MFFQVKIKSEPLSDEAYDDGVVIDGSYPDSEVCMNHIDICLYGCSVVLELITKNIYLSISACEIASKQYLMSGTCEQLLSHRE